MPVARSRRRLTVDDYFDVELRSEAKHEFLEGQILAMAGSSPRHNAVCRNVVRLLATTLRGRCEVFGSDQRVATPDDLYTYPDVSVFCGPPEWSPGRPATGTNPRVLVEVLSDSTRDYDRGEKLERYQSIPSLSDVLLVDTASTRIEHWTRTPDGWTCTPHDAGSVALVGCAAVLPVAEVYEGAFALPD